MAKFILKAGAEADLLSEDELDDRMTRSENFFAKLMREEEGEIIVRSQTFTTDGSGNTTAFDGGAAQIYRVPVGFDAILTRLSVDYPGSNAATPTTCDVRIVADVNSPSSLVGLNNSVPTVFTAGRNKGPIFRGGQRVSIAMTGGPHTTVISVRLQVVLTRRLALRADAETPVETRQLVDAPLDRP